MRTVGELKQELAKFPDDAICWAYEGEVNGIIIQRGERGENYAIGPQGVIHCSEGDEDVGKETILLP